ncbi:putative uncharacterized protein [Clostridium sp. CAG:1013]|nr:putative uncharacterized protein [Clostridium sp. CAG:1013]
MVQSALAQGLRGRGAVLGQNVLFQGAGIHPDADGNPMGTAGVRHGLHPGILSDVAGVDTDLIDAGSHCFQGQLVVKMDIRHQRDAYLLFDGGDQGHSLFIGDSSPEDLTARLLQTHRLGHTARNIRGGHIEHGLHRHRRAAANSHASCHHLFRLPAFHKGFPFPMFFSLKREARWYGPLFGFRFYPCTIRTMSLNAITTINPISNTKPVAWT